ncbi:MAG: hypothetical protein AAF393_16460 [Pseudomonadota bacterium]
MIRLLIPAMAAAMLAAPHVATAASDTTALKTKLQAYMQREVDRRLIDGALLSLDYETGDSTALYPVEAHPMIMTFTDGSERYVLCSDLKTIDGKSHTVDYYMAKNGNRYTIFKTEINNRKPLKSMMKAGKVTQLK